MGADKYLLFPAWQENEWEGRGTHCDRGVRDTDKPAGSFLPHWHLKSQYTTESAMGQIHCDRQLKLGCLCVWVCDGGEESEREGMGEKKQRQADSQKDDNRNRDTSPGKKEGASEKESREGYPLRAVYMTDHQQNSQDNRAKRIHNIRQCCLKEKRHWCYEYTCPFRLFLLT